MAQAVDELTPKLTNRLAVRLRQVPTKLAAALAIYREMEKWLIPFVRANPKKNQHDICSVSSFHICSVSSFLKRHHASETTTQSNVKRHFLFYLFIFDAKGRFEGAYKYMIYRCLSSFCW